MKPAKLTPRQRILAVVRQISVWRPGGYIRASASLFGWLLLRAAAQAVLVLVLARSLGAAGYGHFVTVLAVVGFFTPLAGLGLQGVILRDGARAPERLPELLGGALALWWRATLVIGVAALATTLWVVPDGVDVYGVAAFVFAEIASSSLVEMIGRAEQAKHHGHRYGAITAGLVLARLAALPILEAAGWWGVSEWLWTYAAASALYAMVLGAWLVVRRRPIGAGDLRWGLVRDGTPFIVGAVSLRLQGEFNKPSLASLDISLAGNFSVAQRVTDLASLPLIAMQESLWARLYASDTPWRRLVFTGTASIALAVVAGLAMVWAAPLLPLLLGRGFEEAASVLVWLAWLPAMQVVRNFGNFALLTAGQPGDLTRVYLIVGVAGVVLNIGLIAGYGMTGAILAIYSTESIAILAQIVFLRRKIWR